MPVFQMSFSDNNRFNDAVSEMNRTLSLCNFLMRRDWHKYLYCLFPSVKGILNYSEILLNMSSRSPIVYTKFIKSYIHDAQSIYFLKTDAQNL